MISLFSKTVDQATIQILNDKYGFNISEFKLSKANGDVFRTDNVITFNDEFISDIKRLNKKLALKKAKVMIIVSAVSYKNCGVEVGCRIVDMVSGYDFEKFCSVINEKETDLENTNIMIDNITLSCFALAIDKV